MSESENATAAHQEYLAEARGLIDDQIEALFTLIATAAERVGASNGRQPSVARQGHALTVVNGARTAVFTVESITDLPEGADRAQAFPVGQARCTMRCQGDVMGEWELHRIGEGDAAPGYAWMRAGTETPISPEEVATLL